MCVKQEVRDILRASAHVLINSNTFCIDQVVRDILVVAAHAAAGLKNDQEVRALLRNLQSKAVAARVKMQSLGWRPSGALVSGDIGGGRGGGFDPEALEGNDTVGGGSLNMKGGLSALEFLRREVGGRALVQ